MTTASKYVRTIPTPIACRARVGQDDILANGRDQRLQVPRRVPVRPGFLIGQGATVGSASAVEAAERRITSAAAPLMFAPFKAATSLAHRPSADRIGPAELLLTAAVGPPARAG